MNGRPLTDEGGEVRELTAEDFKSAKPLPDVEPGLIGAMMTLRREGGRPRAEAPKVYIGFRMAADLVSGIKAGGRGYNGRVEKVLREALDEGKL